MNETNNIVPSGNTAASEAWHALAGEIVAERLEVNLEKGLSLEEAGKRLERHGKNILEKKKGFNAAKIIMAQFSSVLIWVLIVAALISFWLGDEIDAGVILGIIVLNAFLGFRQEFKAEKAMQALERMAVAKAVVLRNGKEQEISSTEIVPGDIIVLREGDKVPADARIIESVNMKTNEAALSGESNPVSKQQEKLSEKMPVADRTNILFTNTTVVFGRGRAIVVATGMKTEFGKISGMIQAIEKGKTPLAKNIDSFGKKLAIAILLVCIGIFAIGIASDNEIILMFLTSVSLAVAAVPEGLPAVVTITLALGMRTMASKKAVVRKMSAVETLGSTSVICSDKTGTLTKNEMTVKKIQCNGKLFDVTGTGFNATGKILLNEKGIGLEKEKELELLLKTGILCNNAELYENSWIGDPTEIALLAAAKKAGMERKELKKGLEFIEELPFDSVRKRMSVVFGSEKEKIVFCKGSVESVLEKSSGIMLNGKILKLDADSRNKMLEQNNALAKKGYRVLGLAFKQTEKKLGIKEIESGLVFLGMTAMIDSPRTEAIEALELCRKAGIEVKMITGDHVLTAVAIAKQLGIMRPKTIALEGKDINAMSDSELEAKVSGISVFARVNPEHKLRIVEALQKKGLVVAVTGDGVNDAPALKKSDIGVAMGITGTEVSKEASDLVILDDNFATIVSAINEGRKIFENIKNFVKYLLGTNASEVMLIVFAIILEMIFGNAEWPLPLLPVHLLFINLITDGLPAIALGNEPAYRELMSKSPRKKHEGILHNTVPFIFVAGMLGAVMALAAFRIGMASGITEARTMAFATLIIFETIIAFNCRSEKTIFEMDPFGNKSLVIATIVSLGLMLAVINIPMIQLLLSTSFLSMKQWAIVIGLALPAAIAPYFVKAFKKTKTTQK